MSIYVIFTAENRKYMHVDFAINGWSPKIPKRPNFRFSPDVWVVPNEKIWASDQKIERGGRRPFLFFFGKPIQKPI